MTLLQGTGLKSVYLKSKIEYAKDLIKKWLDICDYQVYASVSGGKDSLVMADLITQVYHQCPLVWINEGPLATWHDCNELLYKWKNHGRNLIELCPALSLVTLFKYHGIPLQEAFHRGLNNIITRRLNTDVYQEYEAKNNTRGYSWGIRTQESRGRRNYINKYGDLYQKNNDIWVCSPVARWTVKDIWAYINSNKLDYPACYENDRQKFRNGAPVDVLYLNNGKLADMKKYQPELFLSIVKQFPELATFA